MAGPWEKYATEPQAETGPWAKYAAKEQPGVMADMAKSADAGVARAVAGMGGLLGDATNLGALGIEKATNFVTDKLGMERPAPRDPSKSVLNAIPTSESLGKSIQKEFYGGAPEYQPQTIGGEYARTAGEFVPGLMGGGAGIARRALTQVAAPAIASETAGQVTQGTAAEPYARAGAAIATGGILAPRPTAQRVMPAELKSAADSAYKSPEVKGLVLEPSATDRLATQITRAMEAGGARRSKSGEAFSAVDELRGGPQTQVAGAMRAGGLNPGSTVDDIKSARTALGEVVRDNKDPLTGKLNSTGNAANTAKREITSYLDNVPQADVRSGNAAAAGKKLSEATANYGTYKRADMVEALNRRADINTGAANSGQNANNNRRGQLKRLLQNEKMSGGFNAPEMAQLEKAVLGTNTGNTARFIGNALAPSGAMAVQNSAAAAGLGGMAAYGAGNDPTTAALVTAVLSQVVGRGARRVGNASQARQTAKFQDMVSARSPLGQQVMPGRIAGAKQQTIDEQKAALVRALLNSQIMPRTQAQQN